MHYTFGQTFYVVSLPKEMYFMSFRHFKRVAKRPPRLQFASTFFLYIKKLFITHLVKLFTLCTLPRQLKLEMYFE
jgi:hypothetical protein